MVYPHKYVSRRNRCRSRASLRTSFGVEMNSTATEVGPRNFWASSSPNFQVDYIASQLPNVTTLLLGRIKVRCSEHFGLAPLHLLWISQERERRKFIVLTHILVGFLRVAPGTKSEEKKKALRQYSIATRFSVHFLSDKRKLWKTKGPSSARFLQAVDLLVAFRANGHEDIFVYAADVFLRSNCDTRL